MKRAVFMGSDMFSLPVFEALLRDGETLQPPVTVIVAITKPDRPAGRWRRTATNPVRRQAQEHSVTTLQPESLRDERELQTILNLEPDLIVVASFGQILPGRLLDSPTYGCLNLHPSLLPKYRGPAPIVGAILEGETETGTTLMLMSRQMDAGPIAAQDRTSIGEDETAGELMERLAQMSASLLVRQLPNWLNGAIVPRPQDEDRATYTRLTTKADGLINWTQPAAFISRQVRAYNPWPAAFTFFHGRQLKILRAHPLVGTAEPGEPLLTDAGDLAVGTGDGLLRLDEVQLEGARQTTASAFRHGHRDFLHTRLSSDPAWSLA